ncbi:MAG: signal peptidase I [Patescibacteria group bacterium]
MDTEKKVITDVWVKPDQDRPADPEEKGKNIFVRMLDLVFDFLQSIALGGAFFVVLYLYIIQPHQVKGNSMYPTYKDKEYILTDKITYKFKSPERGEVIILQSPKNPDIEYIKRIIGLPGDLIRVKDGRVYLNEKPLNESAYLQVLTPIFPGGFLQEDMKVTIPPDNFFVMGDNRPGSSDSREFGFVPVSHVVGHVIFRYFPLDRFGVIEKPSYSL